MTATPEQWAAIEEWGNLGSTRDACVLELRNRIEALEANVPDHIGDANKMVNSSAGLTGSLVERVVVAIHSNICADPNLYLHEARAAIREVADWLRTDTDGRHGLLVADWLEQEADK